MSAHSHIGASSMYRWSKCPGSVRLCKDIPNRQSVYAEEGVKAHEIASSVLTTGSWPKDLDSETYEAVKVYVDTINTDLLEDEKHLILIEHKFDLSSLYPGLFGTADAVIYLPKSKLLRVYDYKHGAGVPVNVSGNPQLMYYGLGALLSTGHPCDEIELIIVQPRCFHPDGPVRRSRMKSYDLIDFAADLVAYAKETEKEDAPLHPGSHCQFCSASGVCPAIHEKALTLAKDEFKSVLNYDPEKLSQILHWLPTLQTWIQGVREFAYSEAFKGNLPPGWKLVQKRVTRRWKDEVTAVEKLKSDLLLQDEMIFNKTLKSPAQIEKLLNREGKDSIGDLILAESSGLSLAPDLDNREPVVKITAKDEFTATAIDVVW